MLDRFEVGDEVTLSELREMGWHGEVSQFAEVKSMFQFMLRWTGVSKLC